VKKIAGKKCRAAANEDFRNKAFIHKFMYRAIKRSIDVLFALIGLIMSIPIIVIAFIFIKLETEGPIIYIQERVGKDGCTFLIYKLRTMYCDAEKDGIQWAQKNDPRVTKVGRFLRRTRIDELPQFINVLKGDMSIVGPRPERSYFVEEFSKKIPEFNERLAVRPGLTGWSQINGGYELSPEEKLKSDLFYIKNQSILLDMKIILKTIKIVITSEGAR
jgi:exopolysaccharide biosynthesis polyprenyl glycosylphosphotransferase